MDPRLGEITHKKLKELILLDDWKDIFGWAMPLI